MTITLQLRKHSLAVPERRLTFSLHIPCALRRTDKSIYSEVGQKHLNTWKNLQQLTPSGFAFTAVLPKLKLQPTYIVTFEKITLHVLKALRTMSVYDFPMRRYVVEAQSEGHAPTYLLTVPPTQYIIESGLTDIKFPLLSPELWPSAKQLGLDDSQYEAFKFAVTREFVIIQGNV
ncbi:hypothetical protein C0J52_07669 [Blattella germanica]|nr:hypothetical protein C0J52_07669 [Blattella germanica]